MPKVFASCYIVYVGIAAAAITVPVYEKPAIGSAAFWFGFISLIVDIIAKDFLDAGRFFGDIFLQYSR